MSHKENIAFEKLFESVNDFDHIPLSTFEILKLCYLRNLKNASLKS